MSQKKKWRGRKVTSYDRTIRGFVDAYAAATGRRVVNLMRVAEWAIAQGLYQPPPNDARKKLARDLARVSREDYFEDEEGNPIRRRHAYKVVNGDQQLTFWVNLEDATPHQMRMCATQRRNGIRRDVEQLDRDVKYYNRKYNPGDPIDVIWDFTVDMEEKEEPTDYQDMPPDDETTGPPDEPPVG